MKKKLIWPIAKCQTDSLCEATNIFFFVGRVYYDFAAAYFSFFLEFFVFLHAHSVAITHHRRRCRCRRRRRRRTH